MASSGGEEQFDGKGYLTAQSLHQDGISIIEQEDIERAMSIAPKHFNNLSKEVLSVQTLLLGAFCLLGAF